MQSVGDLELAKSGKTDFMNRLDTLASQGIQVYYSRKFGPFHSLFLSTGRDRLLMNSERIRLLSRTREKWSRFARNTLHLKRKTMRLN